MLRWRWSPIPAVHNSPLPGPLFPWQSAHLAASPAPGAALLGQHAFGVVSFHLRTLAREGRMTVTIGRRELLAALGGAAIAWPLAARGQASVRFHDRTAQQPRPPFGRIEPAAEIGSRATDGRPLEQALAEIAVVAALALEQD